MICIGATITDLEKALSIINKQYEGNIEFKVITAINRKGDRVRFTLTVCDSRKAGARRGVWDNRRVHAACWHAHGDFFDALLTIVPSAIIRSSYNQGEIEIYKDRDGDIQNNWRDWNIGSQMHKVNYSQACECTR